MFRDDFEFSDDQGASHLGAQSVPIEVPKPASAAELHWEAAAERELGKIPFFVRGKARRNTEKFAAERGVATITIGTLYEAKSHYAR
jgi:light-independent protochlorophyllide reductase subunit B